MSELVTHALDNVWRNNNADNQLVFKPFKLTNDFGCINYINIMQKSVDLPSKGTYYHVYQIGQLYPQLIGLLLNKPAWTVGVWRKFSDTINYNDIMVNVYDRYGVEVPRFMSHYMFTDERTLIFAMEINNKVLVDFNTELYVRLYSNSFFKRPDINHNEHYIYTYGKVIKNNDDILATQVIYNTYTLKTGHVFAYCNGLLISNINLLTIKPFDVVEFVYDSSIKQMISIPVELLQTFTSTLDGLYKYLIHYPNNSLTIDYMDDIDIHIVYIDAVKETGCYYYKNTPSAVRMVTHRDYSIPVEYFVNLARHLTNTTNGEIDLRNYRLQIAIRMSGVDRKLIFDNNRIFELYKLPTDKIQQAMVGVNATVPEWRAENLENSYYTKLMNSLYSEIDVNLVQRAYGYNSISKLVADNPTKTIFSSNRYIGYLPKGLSKGSTIYEYYKGLLVGYYYNDLGSEYPTVNQATLLEGIKGKGQRDIGTKLGTNNIPINPKFNYRVYYCYINDGKPNNQWVDVTGTEHYTIENDTVVWTSDINNQYLLVKTDEYFLAHAFDLEQESGLLTFVMTEIINNEIVPLQVPGGNLDIWVNGYSCIENLDYKVQFPHVVITNKKFLVQPITKTSQRIVIRYVGFSDNLQPYPINDFGFIQHGFMSNNFRFDIRDDKVLRITSNGLYLDRDSIEFSEEHTGISITNSKNGHPYQVKDMITPINEWVTVDYLTMMNDSKAIDKRVSDYLTRMLPQPPRSKLNAIIERYELISPFLSHLLFDIVDNVIDKNYFIANLSDTDISNTCKRYEHLLAFDPTDMDSDYVIVIPHGLNSPLRLNPYQYQFIKNVIRLYYSNKILVESHLTISNQPVN